MEISGIINHPHINFDHPMFQQNIMQIINGFQQIQMPQVIHMNAKTQAIMTPHDLETYRDR